MSIHECVYHALFFLKKESGLFDFFFFAFCFLKRERKLLSWKDGKLGNIWEEMRGSHDQNVL